MAVDWYLLCLVIVFRIRVYARGLTLIGMLLPFSFPLLWILFLRGNFRARLRRKTRSQPWFPLFFPRLVFLVDCGVSVVGVFC